MSWRMYSVLVGLTVVTLFSGCASQPRTGGVEVGDQVEAITGPSALIAGARIDDVRSVALGSARSKGWTIVSVSNQKVVLRRPVSPDAPQAVEAGLGSDGAPPSVEVTSLFRQVPGGVSVTVNAQLVANVQGDNKDASGPVEQRIDYTESYRDNLRRSLESLRSTWAAHHQRVAGALPPINAAGQAAAETAAELKGDDAGAAGVQQARPLQSPLAPQPALTAWGAGPDAESEPVTEAPAPVAAVPEPEPAPVPPPTQVKTAPQPKPRATASSTVQAVAQPTAQAASSSKPKAPVAKQAAAKPAGSLPTPARTPRPQTQPPAKAVPVSGADNMVTLNRRPQTGSEIANAERYAAGGRCRVQSGRTVVFKRDGASEYLRVYCTGDPAFVVKCTNGVCKRLE